MRARKTSPLTPRARAVLTLAALFLAIGVIVAVLAFEAGSRVAEDLRISQLEQQVEQLQTDVSLLRE